jgi:hypothetical protein
MLYKGYRFTIHYEGNDEYITLFDDSNKTDYSVWKIGTFLFNNLTMILDDLVERAEIVRNTDPNDPPEFPF